MELGDYLIKVMEGIKKGKEGMEPPRKLVLLLDAEGNVVSATLVYGSDCTN